jgi:hypothetical protein
MIKNYVTMGILARSKKPEGDSARKAAAPFLEDKAVMSIYGGPTPHESCCKLKLTGRVINSVSTSILGYLCWSKSLTTFDWMDYRIASQS